MRPFCFSPSVPAVVLLVHISFLSDVRAQGPNPISPPLDLDEFVASVMNTFEVPGVGLAIVRDGQVVVSKGYGFKELGETDLVNDQTLFGIASNTKAFTATALGLLVEEEKLEWDAPVVNYLPWFQLADPYVTRELTIRDLLVHRSGLGLGAGDLLWWPTSDYDRKEIVRRLRFLPLATSFRTAYAYDNVLYSVAGEVIEEVSGQPWEDFVESRILEKVGMDGSNVRHSEAENATNVATPHAPIEGSVRTVSTFTSDNVNPAGGINSSASDMAKWVITQLDSGLAPDGSRLFTPALTRELWAPVTPIPIGNPSPELAALKPNFLAYGLGFGLADYRGHKIVRHTGGLPGYVSMVTMVPDLKLGIVVLTNQESGAAFRAITYHVVDHYLNAPPTDWLAAYAAVVARFQTRVETAQESAVQSRDTGSRPSLSLEGYAGNYVDAWYGDISITMEDEQLVIRFSHTPALTGDLTHWQHDTFVARWRDRELRADAYVTFALNPDGSIEQAKMRAVSPATDFSFDFHHLLLKPVR